MEEQASGMQLFHDPRLHAATDTGSNIEKGGLNNWNEIILQVSLGTG